MIARIPLYQVPGAPQIVEMTELNNIAQTNYDRFIPSTASPSTRELLAVDVTNPYDEEVTVVLTGAQTNDVYRVLIGNRWLRLKPHESVDVPLWFEFDPETIAKLRRVPNRVGMSAWAKDPRAESDSFGFLGGAMAEVQTGRRTEIKLEEVGDRRVRGYVHSVDTAEPVDNGRVIVTLDPSGAREEPQRFSYVHLGLHDGFFATDELPDDGWRLLWVDYLPDADYAPATSEDAHR